jgi:hypothetical protein
MVARVETDPTFKPGKPAVLFRDTYYSPITGVTVWDLSPDAKRFLMLKEVPSTAKPAAETPGKIDVVVNWLEELKQRVPVD